MTPISKEEFMVILERRQSSGLSIKDFCSNESYVVSSFHYRKSKFGLTSPYNTHAGEADVKKLTPYQL
jgi:putative transposase